MPTSACLGVLAVLFLPLFARAQMNSQYMTSPEALAMGNAQVAYVTDEYSLFYNPAGLGRNESWRFFPISMALASTSQILSVIQSTGGLSASDLGGSLEALAGKKVFADATLFPVVQVPYFAGGALFRVKADLSVRNPPYAQVVTDLFTEYGFVAGFSFPLFPKYLFFGVSGKYVSRSNALTADLTPSETFSLINSGSFLGQLRSGSAYSANMGIQFRMPTGLDTFIPVLGLAWEDIGTLKFRNSAATPPSRVNDSLNAGFAFTYKFPLGMSATLAADLRRLLDTDLEYTQKLHIGVKLQFPVMTLYGGINQGYLTGGMGFEFPFMEIMFHTYEEELGSYTGARGDRRYQFSLKMGFDFEGFKLGSFSKRRR